MSGERIMEAAAIAVHELLGDRMAFTIVAWVPGKGEIPGAVAYACDPVHSSEAPTALTTASQLLRLNTTAGAA